MEKKIKANDLKCEFLKNPLAVDLSNPRLSWCYESENSIWEINKVQIIVSSNETLLNKNQGDLWDSGLIDPPENNAVNYDGRVLKSRQGCFWKIGIKDKKNITWSAPSYWEMGLLLKQDWLAYWIGFPRLRVEKAPYFRKTINTEKSVQKARLYICGLGYYEAYINNKRIGDNLLDPAQTDYETRVFYECYDITENIVKGENAIGIILGNGMYNQNRVWNPGNAYQNPVPTGYGLPRLICQVELQYNDETKVIIPSDDSWKWNTGPILANNVYAGESYDARLELGDWTSPGYDDSECDREWKKAIPVEGPGGRLCSQLYPPIKENGKIKPVEIFNPDQGKYVFDMGQNFSGWVRLKVHPKDGTDTKGKKIVLRFSEAVNKDKTINVESTGVFATNVVQTDEYICKGNSKNGKSKTEIWEPKFTWHGFQYVEITGYPGEVDLETITGIIVNNKVESVGNFSCSNPLLNKLHEAVRWTFLSNLHGLPEDCPVRERCGWLADAYIAAETGMLNFDLSSFYNKFIDDIETTRNDGVPYDIAPGKRRGLKGCTDWTLGFVILPWYHYLYYGDISILKKHYQGMRFTLDWLKNRSGSFVFSEGRGDWSDPKIKTAPTYTSQMISTSAWVYYSMDLMEKVSGLLNDTSSQQKYKEWKEKTKQAFMAEFYDRENHTYKSQTANSMAIQFGLYPEGDLKKIIKSLVHDIEKNHNKHVSTGIFGLRWLFPTLSENGHGDLVIELMCNETKPSFAYLLNKGATTLWEYWDEKEVDDFNGPRSHNHPMMGGFNAWFYQGILGINYDTEKPGFKKIILKPQFIKSLDWAKGSYNSVMGKITSHWKRKDNNIIWKFSNPLGTELTVQLTGCKKSNISLEEIDNDISRIVEKEEYTEISFKENHSISKEIILKEN